MASVSNSVRTNTPFLSIKLILILCVIFAILKTGAMATTAFSILLCFWSLLGAKQAIQALSLVVIIKNLNPALYAFSAGFGIIAWVLLIVAGLRLFISGSFRHIGLLFPLIIFVIMVTILSAVQTNEYPEVSLMKLLIFAYGTASLLIGFAALKDEDAHNLTVWFFSLFATVVILSIPILPFPAIAYARNGTGFQGILVHPQTFGPVLAPVAAWVFARIIFSKHQKIIKSIVIGLLITILIILSQARTGIVAVVLSLAVTCLVILFKSKRFHGFRMGRLINLVLLATMVLCIGLASSTTIRGKLSNFVFKHQSKNIEQALSTRSGGIEGQWRYFIQKPLVGHGFGVYPSGSLSNGVVKIMGIPISAPIEKGFLPTAILEETGLLGTLPLLYFIASLAARIAKHGDASWLALFFACVFVNAGEMVFFSLGGIGLYFWLWIGLATRASVNNTPIKQKSPKLTVKMPIWEQKLANTLSN